MFDVLGWLLLVLAGVLITLLALHVESEKKLSYKFTITVLVISSFCVGYGMHFLLMATGA